MFHLLRRSLRIRNRKDQSSSSDGPSSDGPSSIVGIPDSVESTSAVREVISRLATANSVESAPTVSDVITRSATANNTTPLDDPDPQSALHTVAPPARFQHIYKSKTNSSQRVQAASFEAYQASEAAKATSRSGRFFRKKQRRARKKQRKQQHRLRQVQETEAAPDQKYSTDFLASNHVYIDGGSSTNPPIAPEPQEDSGKEPVVLQIRNKDVHVLQETENGAIFRPDLERPPVFLLPPRADNLSVTGDDPTELIASLRHLEGVTKKSHERGKDKVVVHQEARTKYVCAGNRPNRKGEGVDINVNVKEVDARSWNKIVDYVVRCETAFTKWIDSNILGAIRFAKEIVNYARLPRKGSGKKTASIFGSIAFGQNVYLNSHWDADFTYSIVTVHRPPRNGRSKYDLDDDIICYFVFPRYGMAVPLRPGDILIFNPQEYHSVSSRVCDEDDISCLSIYLKSAIVGLWDNDIELTQEQEAHAELYAASERKKKRRRAM